MIIVRICMFIIHYLETNVLTREGCGEVYDFRVVPNLISDISDPGFSYPKLCSFLD